ncbi:MAG: stage 0 sporulation protein [Spirochaetota bacterium]|nr:MAG: stage 0 sporulation protein [Spirochaetota bacterium]
MSDDKGLVVAKLIYNNATHFFELPDFEIAKGYLIIIETENGPEIASVSGITYTVPEDVQVGKIIRVCNEDDLTKIKENEKREEEAFNITLEKIKKHNLDMKLVNIHYFMDDNKIIFNFTADERVDFRELVKDLASVFKKRIELRQIGARDEAKIVKGFGICGRDFCCNTVKNELKPVTIKMAKDQNLTLNSSKISGACGRLLCCLAYEHDCYCEIKKMFPSEGSTIDYEDKKVTLTEINILKMIGTLKTEDDIYIQIPLDELPTLTNDSVEKKEPVTNEG